MDKSPLKKSYETLSPKAKQQLAAWLRKRFAKSINPTLLEKISDDSLVEQYFKNAEDKRQSLAKPNICSNVD